MPYRVEFTPAAERDLRKLAKGNRDIARRIAEAVAKLKDDTRPNGVKKLTGTSDTIYRIVVGTYRVLYTIDDGELLIIVIRIAHRSEVYARPA